VGAPAAGELSCLPSVSRYSAFHLGPGEKKKEKKKEGKRRATAPDAGLLLKSRSRFFILPPRGRMWGGGVRERKKREGEQALYVPQGLFPKEEERKKGEKKGKKKEEKR